MSIIESFCLTQSHPALCVDGFLTLVTDTISDGGKFAKYYKEGQMDLARLFYTHFIDKEKGGLYRQEDNILRHLPYTVDHTDIHFRFPDGSHLSCIDGTVSPCPYIKQYDKLQHWSPPRHICANTKLVELPIPSVRLDTTTSYTH